MLIINTGNGKGKTTAAIGQIIRALGHGWKVCLMQLFKGESFYGEQKILKKLKNLKFYSFAPKHPFCFPNAKNEIITKQCQDALILLRKITKSKRQFDLIVLDEFNIALRDGWIKLKELLEILKELDSKSNVLITGRCAPKQLIQEADIVTEMKEIQHSYQKGIKAHKGIEY